MKNILWNGLLLGSSVLALTIAGCGSADQKAASSVSTDSMAVTDAVIASSSAAIEEESAYTSQTFHDLTYEVPTEWLATANFESDTEEGTLNLDYYPSSDCTISLMYYDYSAEVEEGSATSMDAVALGLSAYVGTSDGMDASAGMQLFPSNQDLFVSTLDGSYSGEDESGSFNVNAHYYFFPGESGVYQVWICTANTVDSSPYERAFKAMYNSMVLEDKVVEQCSTSKYHVFFKAAIKSIVSEYSLDIIDADDGSYQILLNDTPQDLYLTFDDEHITMKSGSLDEEDTMIAMQFSLAELVYITSPEAGLVEVAYEETNNMLSELQENAYIGEEYNIEYQKNIYHFTLTDSSFELTIDLR